MEGVRLVTTSRLMRAATLEGFADEVARVPGVSLDDLQPLTTLLVQTRNSEYRITRAEGELVLVQGGRFFPQLTRASLDGASLGGSLIKVGWIGLGFRMELRTGDQRVLTSPVLAIATLCDASRRVH